MTKIKLGISGISGKMGLNVLSIAKSMPEEFDIVAGFHSSKEDIQGITCYNTAEEFLSNVDLVIDFSSRDTLITLLKAIKTPVKFVSGTTGITSADLIDLHAYSKKNALFWAPNFSIGVALFKNLLNQILPMVSPYDYDIELLERHHKFKKDAPSGTAFSLLQQIADFKNKPLEEIIHHNTVDNPVRPDGAVGVSFQRGGGIIGEHEISFIGQFEEFSIKHTAFDRKVFANGAIAAAKWLWTKQSGYYTITDMLK